jgi:hypothetical protein
MFPLYDKTRRRLAFLGFVLLCLLPTCAIAGWCLWRNSSWETHVAAERLRMQLGWKVKLGNLKHTKVGTDVYENLELSDAESERKIFSCKTVSVAVRQIPDLQDKKKPFVVCIFERGEIEADGFSAIHALLERALQDQIAPETNIFFQADELVIRRGETRQSYNNVVSRVEHYEKSALGTILYSATNSKGKKPAIFFYRNRNVTPPENCFSGPLEDFPPDLVQLLQGEK